ncbi:FecR family protein [Gelidibacter gilvus]|uniref:DUF4974 domain-containing protein n=1 Tax=Gelidibacter gilvus TaxID=59602 RepID=A0A4Q0XFK3_9FLAO|nr:FecR domain-containing protein [Gelidibacter gilvus]RXJ49453.1 DUF4974 domain-containing protein [Gelidibacter gilvus]
MDNNFQKNINFKHLSKEEKAQLKQRISNSVYGYIKRKRLLKYGIGVSVAVVVIFLSIGIFNAPTSHPSPIEVFAKTVKDLESSGKVQLVLSDDQNIEITEDHSAISYSSTGEEVQIGNENSINQKTSHKNQPVFNTLIVPFGKRSEIVLSDGSKVWLNSGSKLIFPAQFSEDKREVYLQGEAIFEVAHRQKQPFMVKSEHHEIEVLGTIFNVSNYNDDQAIYTVLQSGSIQINVTENKLFNSQKHIKITPGTLATFDKDDRAVKTQSVATEPYFSWRDGIFIFKNDSLKSIMKKISRYYNVEIIINNDNLANETFSGYLDVKETIEHVMQTIKSTESSEFEYHLTQDNQLIIN